MELDVNVLRSIATVLGLVTFIGLIVWVYARNNAASFDKAANLPFEQD
jgi:cytochrome c oxidase cbb3-type subunit 4